MDQNNQDYTSKLQIQQNGSKYRQSKKDKHSVDRIKIKTIEIK